MTDAIIPEELATRVHDLVKRHDGGNASRAARRIGAREVDLQAILEARSARPSVAALSAIVRGYDVDTWWLITGETQVSSNMSSTRGVDTLELLSELGSALTMQRRLDTSLGALRTTDRTADA